MEEGLTYNDVLIKPKYSEVISRKNVTLKTKLTKNISLLLPIISSNMDTITESEMAIEIAKKGGLGIIHRYCSINQQVEMVKKVKRYTNFIIDNPHCIDINENIHNLLETFREKNVGSLLIIENNILKGIVTNRDLLLTEIKDNSNLKIKNIMTPLKEMIFIKYFESNNIELMKEKLINNRIEQLPIIDSEYRVKGLITLKDIILRKNNVYNINSKMQLIVGAAVGVKGDYLERTTKLIEAGCDIICIDVAHGHHILCGNAVLEIKKLFPTIDIIAGNVCTAEGVRYLKQCGADCVKVGVGPGSICITRKQTGCGFPQLSAVMECGEEANKLGISIIADGGHSGTIGNIFKALVAGSSASMLGGMISGTKETPGKVLVKGGKQVKMIRGMAGRISNLKKSTKNGENVDLENMTPEGVEGYVEYKGPVSKILDQISGGLRSGFSYVGCQNIDDIRKKNIKFVKISSNSYIESGSHDIKEM